MILKKRWLFNIRFVAAASVCLIALIAYLSVGDQKSFPSIPSGAYCGEISSIGNKEGITSSFYLERVRNAESLLLVVFQEGWIPQIVPLQPKTAISKQTEMKFLPIVVSYQGESYTLFGSRDGNSFSGSVVSSKGAHGSWSIDPVSAKKLRQQPIKVGSQFNLHAWLAMKGKYYTATKKYRELQEHVKKLKNQEDILTHYLADENALRSQAERKKAELQSELHQILTENRKNETRLRSDVAELEQLTRITARGRAIELARRVSKRENKWYFVNWETGTDLSALEDSFAQKMNIDLLKLNTKARNAEEVHALRNTIAKERAQVIELQRRYQQKLAPHRSPPQGRPLLHKPRKQPWWERWDTVFGVVSK